MAKCVLLLALFISLCVSEELRLIQFNESHSEWLPFSAIEKLMVQRVNFMDITEYPNLQQGKVVEADPLPVEPIHKIYVNNILPNLSLEKLKSTLTTLTAFNTRYYTSTTGVDAAKWISEQFKAIAAANERTDITVELFTHTFAQPSVVTTIPGIGPEKDQVVVIGAHEDSIGSSSTGRSPGADDDGSGTVTVLEVFRTLVEAGYEPDRTVKFITYAGEEAGLLGSQAIAQKFKNDAVDVYAALQLDMTGYGGVDDIGVVTDFVDANLTSFVKILIDTYSLLDWVDTRCGYACSDHASWNRAGYRSAFPFETVFSRSNPYIHSANDLIDRISIERILEFAKVAVGFVVELAGLAIRP